MAEISRLIIRISRLIETFPEEESVFFSSACCFFWWSANRI